MESSTTAIFRLGTLCYVLQKNDNFCSRFQGYKYLIPLLTSRCFIHFNLQHQIIRVWTNPYITIKILYMLNIVHIVYNIFSLNISSIYIKENVLQVIFVYNL